jgi:hypothetical protein
MVGIEKDQDFVGERTNSGAGESLWTGSAFGGAVKKTISETVKDPLERKERATACRVFKKEYRWDVF